MTSDGGRTLKKEAKEAEGKMGIFHDISHGLRERKKGPFYLSPSGTAREQGGTLEATSTVSTLLHSSSFSLRKKETNEFDDKSAGDDRSSYKKILIGREKRYEAIPSRKSTMTRL